MTDILRPLEWGFPLTLSRNTDIPKFWMRRFFEWKDRGWLYAPHPQNGILRKWSLHSEDVHSLVWWSKDYRPFMRHSRRAELDGYRQLFNMTITGDPLWEKKVPPLEVQLESLAALVHTYGADKVQWRYSPVPLDWSRFDEIALAVSDLGVTECYFSFLHSGTLVSEPRSTEERAAVVKELSNRLRMLGMTLHGCWDDAQFMTEENCRIATCVDADRINRIYGIEDWNLKHLREPKCDCSMSVEVANQRLLPCAHACTYCYATPENTT